MRKIKNSLFYIIIISCFSALAYWIILHGSKLEQGRHILLPTSDESQWLQFVDSLLENIKHPLAILMVQIITIIFIARIFGWICKKIGQPTVIGEILAGIVLGPSLIGLYYPDIFNTLFPINSLDNLKVLSQIGLVLFMFVIGMELDLKVLKNKAHQAVVISHASIILPFALGLGLAYFIYETFAPQGVQFISFGLFIGIAMSITAFPVLARIVQERGIHKTKLGTIVITCAAADDITAWCLLAAVIAVVKAGSVVSALYTILAAVAYVVLMINVVRPFLKRIGDIHNTRENISKPIIAIFFLVLLISSYATEIIGIHTLFGAFMAGAIMPDNLNFRAIFREKMEDVALVLLLPLFFVFTGLRTEIGLINDPYMWKITGLIVLVAVIGKFVGSALAARFVGQNWKDSLTIGALMNTRGLMELVVLNIGYDLGVLTPQIFSMMVIMALVTTFMTSPALNLINYIFKSKDAPEDIKEMTKYKILISFGNPETGRKLLRIANGLTNKMKDSSSVTAMHLSPTKELHHYSAEEDELISFAPVFEESKKINQKITTFFKSASDINSEIINVTNKGDYDLLLIGLGQSIFDGSLLGKVLGFTTRIINPEKLLNTVTGKEKLFDDSPFDERTQILLSNSKVPVGVLIDKKLSKFDRILIPIFNTEDGFLISYAQKLIHNIDAQVVLFDADGLIKNNSIMKEKIRAIEQQAPNHIFLQSDRIIDKDFLEAFDLLIISVGSWKKLVEIKSVWLSDIPSTLLLADKK